MRRLFLPYKKRPRFINDARSLYSLIFILSAALLEALRIKRSMSRGNKIAIFSCYRLPAFLELENISLPFFGALFLDADTPPSFYIFVFCVFHPAVGEEKKLFG